LPWVLLALTVGNKVPSGNILKGTLFLTVIPRESYFIARVYTESLFS
jgi:hypothetical protein